MDYVDLLTYREFTECLEKHLSERSYIVPITRSRREAVDKVLANGFDTQALYLRLFLLSGLEAYRELQIRGGTPPSWSQARQRRNGKTMTC